jgi:phospholipase/lecithinase/hemolysin
VLSVTKPHFLVFLIAVAGGCGWQIHAPTVDHSDTSRDRTWLLHCESADSYEPHTGDTPAAQKARWIFARDGDDEPYTLEGSLVDGFLEVTTLRDAAGRELTASRKTARGLCRDTLARRGGEDTLLLGWVMAARKGEEVNIPPIYPGESPHDGAVTRVVIFGDSLTDTGRLKKRLKIFPAKPYWIGRFSNGPAWPEYLGMTAGLAVQNHSYGGASVIDHEKLPGASFYGRVREVGQFFVSGTIELQISDYLERTLVDGRIERPETTAFLIWAGANDYISKEPVSGLIKTFLNAPEGESGYKGVVERTVSTLLDHVETLYEAGARRFVLINLPDLGRTPIVLQNTTYTPDYPVPDESARRIELARRLSTLTEYHNELLTTSLAELRARLPQAELLLVDSFQYFNVLNGTGDGEIPEKLGYDLSALSVVLEYDGRRLSLQQRCYEGSYIGPYNPENVCLHPEAAVFWDTVHPTTLTHCWQAWSVARTMARAGWTAPPPAPTDYLAWCEQVVGQVVEGSPGHFVSP